MYYNDDSRNWFRFNLVRKADHKHTHAMEFCVGNVWAMIQEYRANMHKMCLLNVSNDTHYIESVQDYKGRYVWKNEEI